MGYESRLASFVVGRCAPLFTPRVSPRATRRPEPGPCPTCAAHVRGTPTLSGPRCFTCNAHVSALCVVGSGRGGMAGERTCTAPCLFTVYWSVDTVYIGIPWCVGQPHTSAQCERWFTVEYWELGRVRVVSLYRRSPCYETRGHSLGWLCMTPSLTGIVAVLPLDSVATVLPAWTAENSWGWLSDTGLFWAVRAACGALRLLLTPLRLLLPLAGFSRGPLACRSSGIGGARPPSGRLSVWARCWAVPSGSGLAPPTRQVCSLAPCSVTVWAFGGLRREHRAETL